tara:strand:- start:11945 stop:12370 length:426 start_codon:yes stop_codon:yes gene_type:complete
MNNIKKNLKDIREGFTILSGQDKLVYLIDLGKKLDLIDIKDQINENKIHACTSQTWIKLVYNGENVSFKANSESTMVKGLLKIIQIGFNGTEQKDILNFIDEFDSAEDLFAWINIGTTISSQRQNGFIGSLNYIKEELHGK